MVAFVPFGACAREMAAIAVVANKDDPPRLFVPHRLARAVTYGGVLDFSELKWCGPPAPPASEELSSGAIGGIVGPIIMGRAYLGVAGAYGAYRTAV